MSHLSPLITARFITQAIESFAKIHVILVFYKITKIVRALIGLEACLHESM